MKRTWPIIGVKDVAASSAWYQSLLGQAQRPPAHPDFDQIRDDDATVLLCVHEWGGHEEGPPLASPGEGEPGNGLVLSFLVEDFDRCLERARAMGATFHSEPQRPEGWFISFSLRDLDGYYVSIYPMQEVEALEANTKEARA